MQDLYVGKSVFFAWDRNCREIVCRSQGGASRGRRGGPPPSSVLSPACALHPSLQPPAESLAIATPDSPGVGLLSVISLSDRIEDFSDFFKLSI